MFSKLTRLDAFRLEEQENTRCEPFVEGVI